jgi:Na+-driven multidrug efflux pump
MILFYATTIVTIFTDDTQVLAETPNALRCFAVSQLLWCN